MLVTTLSFCILKIHIGFDKMCLVKWNLSGFWI